MKCNRLVDSGRRQFLRGGLAATAGAAVTVVAGTEARAQSGPALALVDYPSNRLANRRRPESQRAHRRDLSRRRRARGAAEARQRVPGGVGPDGDIVAFSRICPHKGFPLDYNAADKTLNCPGHYSRFDCETGGQQIWGHATQNLPQYALRVDANGDIYAEGVDELLYGRLSNVL